MLRQSEPERRRMRDDADLDHARYDIYEARKRHIAETAEDADDYTRRVMRLAEEMGI